MFNTIRNLILDCASRRAWNQSVDHGPYGPLSERVSGPATYGKTPVHPRMIESRQLAIRLGRAAGLGELRAILESIDKEFVMLSVPTQAWWGHDVTETTVQVECTFPSRRKLRERLELVEDW